MKNDRKIPTLPVTDRTLPVLGSRHRPKGRFDLEVAVGDEARALSNKPINPIVVHRACSSIECPGDSGRSEPATHGALVG
jgi:hypothetical protein